MPLYQHRFHGATASGDQWVFSWWSDTSLTIDTSHGNAVAWADAFWNAGGVGPGYGAYCTAGVVLNRISTGEITESTGQQQTLRETSVGHAGVAVGNALPADVAIVVSLRTVLANRSGRGRFYLPQPATNVLAADGTLDPVVQQDLVDIASNAWAAANSGGEIPVVYSRTLRSTQAISSFNVGSLLDTQRRRENALTESRLSAAMP